MDTAEMVESTKMSTVLESGWQKQLASEFTEPYMLHLKEFLQTSKNSKKIIYPKSQDVFQAFNLTPFEDTKVVILGQDPYHGPNQAIGLCFAVAPGIKVPPSLQNIYKELKADVNIPIVQHGNLIPWAKQGVFLLNSVLTVEAGKPASHQGKGWEQFTNTVIQRLNAQDRPLVFLLWGAYAQKKGALVDANKHLVLQAAHPSPFAAARGFFGCRHFSKTNEFLIRTGQTPIDWHLPEQA